MDVKRLSGLLVAILAAVSSLDVWPVQAQGRAIDALSRAKNLSCVFSTVASGTWSDAETQATVKAATVKMGFDKIDADEGSARSSGAFGPSDIVVRLSAGTLHFVQSFRDGGALYVTTIFPQRSAAGKLKAVHTRHEYTEISLPGFTSRPEQYYGECAVIE
jgi:hypothetical protein